LVNFIMSTPPSKRKAPCRTAKPPYWKISGDGSEAEDLLALSLPCDVHYSTMEKFSWEFLIDCYITNVTEQRHCQPEWKQMEISVTQASNGFIQSVRINRMVRPSGADDLGHPCNSLFEFQVVRRYIFIVV